MVSSKRKQTEQGAATGSPVAKAPARGAAAMNKEGAKIGGRPKGVPNKITTELKQLVLRAMELAGDKDGGDEGALKYLVSRAKKNPVAYLALISKLIPSKVEAEVNVTGQLAMRLEQARKKADEQNDG